MKSSLLVVCLLVLLISLVYAEGQIDIANAPYTISKSGSYIVVKDLTTPQDVNCITILCSDVTIDLNGHALYGAGTTVGTQGHGVASQNTCNNILVMNGVVRSFRQFGICLTGNNCQVTRIRAYGNREVGIYLEGNGNNVWDNTADNNGTVGIQAGSGSTVKDNSASNNGTIGITAAGGSTVKNNSASNNGTWGISAGSSTVKDNSTYGNDSIGIFAGDYCNITGNTVDYNSYDGINFGYGCMVTNNCISRHLGAPSGLYVGLHARNTDNFIGQNLCTNNGTGILCNVAGNYLEQNKLRGNTTSVTLNGSTAGAGDLANVIIP